MTCISYYFATYLSTADDVALYLACFGLLSLCILIPVCKYISNKREEKSLEDLFMKNRSRLVTNVSAASTTSEQSQIANLEAKINSLNAEISELRKTLRIKDSSLARKEQRITELEKTDFRQKFLDVSSQMQTLRDERDRYKSKLEQYTVRYDTYVKSSEAKISQSESKHLKEKEKYEKEIARLKSTPQQPVPSQHQDAELNGKIKSLEQINETHKNTINSLKKELVEARKASHASKPPAEEERRHYEEKIDKLKEELKEPTYFKNLFTSSLRKLKNEGDSLFYNYPSVHDFLRQVTDKRFHRAMIEDISISEKIQVQASIRSGSSTYVTTLQDCTCVDYNRTHAPCKHMLFLAYHTGVLLIHKEDAEKSMKKYLDQLRTTPVPKK